MTRRARSEAGQTAKAKITSVATPVIEAAGRLERSQALSQF